MSNVVDKHADRTSMPTKNLSLKLLNITNSELGREWDRLAIITHCCPVVN
jgi:hypothetical protein